MTCKTWREMESAYRLSVHNYSDAVDRLDGARNFELSWQKLELARMETERVRSEMLSHREEHLCMPSEVLSHIPPDGKRRSPASTA
jgi:hypothetical protein